MDKITATDEELKALYEAHPLRAVAKMFKVGDETIRKRLIAAGVEIRSKGSAFNQFRPPRDELQALYQHMSMRDIATHYGVGETVVWKRLKQHGIKLRGNEAGGHRVKKGRVFSKSHRRAISKANKGRWSGERNPHWKGGVHQEHLRLRASGDYRIWKEEALELRGYRCQECGAERGSICPCCGTKIQLHVHHVESFSAVPEKRFDPQNSEVLCPKCHLARHHGKPGELRETPTG